MSEEVKNKKKEQWNVYISRELTDEVEELLFALRKQLPREKRKKLTRSEFFELILKSVVLDYRSSQMNSAIQRIVKEWSS